MADEEETPHKQVSSMFFVVEILESILVKVDMKTVLLSQRVDKFWRNVIENSTKLQKKLFLLPASLEEAATLGAPDKKVVELFKDDLHSGFATWSLIEEQESPYEEAYAASSLDEEVPVWETAGEALPDARGPRSPQNMVLNPLLFNKIGSVDTIGPDNRCCRESRHFNLGHLVSKSQDSRESWQRMHLAQPFSNRMILRANLVEKDQEGFTTYHSIAILTERGCSPPSKANSDFKCGAEGALPHIGEILQGVEDALTLKGIYLLKRDSSYFVTTTRLVIAAQLVEATTEEAHSVATVWESELPTTGG